MLENDQGKEEAAEGKPGNDPDTAAPTLTATAGFDPLRDSERACAAKLAEGGNYVIAREFPALIHGFSASGCQAQQAQSAPARQAASQSRRTRRQQSRLRKRTLSLWACAAGAWLPQDRAGAPKGLKMGTR